MLRAIAKTRPLLPRPPRLLPRPPHSNRNRFFSPRKPISNSIHGKSILSLCFGLLLSQVLFTKFDEPDNDKKDADELAKLKALIDSNQGEGVNVYLIDMGFSAIPDTTKDFSSLYVDESEEKPDFHGNCVISILKGNEHSLLKDANIHYYRISDKGGFLEAFEAIAEDAVPPAIVSISVSPRANQFSEEVHLPRLAEASKKLVKEKGIIILSSAGNEGDCKKDPQKLLHRLDDVWIIGNVKQSYWSGVKFFELDETSSHPPCVKFYAIGNEVLGDVFGVLSEVQGTSISTPIAAAYLARILSIYRKVYPEVRPEDFIEVLDKLVSNETLIDKKGAPFIAKCIPLAQKLDESNNSSLEFTIPIDYFS